MLPVLLILFTMGRAQTGSLPTVALAGVVRTRATEPEKPKCAFHVVPPACVRRVALGTKIAKGLIFAHHAAFMFFATHHFDKSAPSGRLLPTRSRTRGNRA